MIVSSTRKNPEKPQRLRHHLSSTGRLSVDLNIDPSVDHLLLPNEVRVRSPRPSIHDRISHHHVVRVKAISNYDDLAAVVSACDKSCIESISCMTLRVLHRRPRRPSGRGL